MPCKLRGSPQAEEAWAPIITGTYVCAYGCLMPSLCTSFGPWLASRQHVQRWAFGWPGFGRKGGGDVGRGKQTKRRVDGIHGGGRPSVTYGVHTLPVLGILGQERQAYRVHKPTLVSRRDLEQVDNYPASRPRSKFQALTKKTVRKKCLPFARKSCPAFGRAGSRATSTTGLQRTLLVTIRGRDLRAKGRAGCGQRDWKGLLQRGRTLVRLLLGAFLFWLACSPSKPVATGPLNWPMPGTWGVGWHR